MSEDTLTQKIQVSRSTSLPVVASAVAGGTYIASVTNLNRDPRGVTKSVEPTAFGRAVGGGALYPFLQAEYDQRVTAAYRSTDMHNQLLCHSAFAPIKDRWNLDSFLRRGSYAEYVAHACN